MVPKAKESFYKRRCAVPQMSGVRAFPEDILFLRVRVASPTTIREWGRRPKGSYEAQSKFATSKHPGRVVSQETVTYKGLIPKMGGLFCERNFGPVESLTCPCGNARVSHEQENIVVCEQCGVELINSRVRRSRMGYIELACPVVHTLWLRGRPSKIGVLLSLKRDDLMNLVYQKGRVWTMIEGRRVAGPRAVKHYLRGIDDVRKTCRRLRNVISVLRSKEKPEADLLKKAIGKLRVLEQFRGADACPSWMVLDALPVLPPGLRPLTSIDGQVYSADANELYKRVVARNNRMISLLMKGHVDPYTLHTGESVLQATVDGLLENSKEEDPLTSPNGLPLQGLSEVLGGKEGRFRQNLLGKRVDFSGRSVIVSGPQLTLSQCGLPVDMAVELFQPQLAHVFMFLTVAKSVVKCREILSKRLDRRAKEAVAEFFSSRIVILNRAPTLHLFGMRAFYVCLSQQLGISLNSLVCTGFNADFDGDTMAVHVPLSLESQLEALSMIPGSEEGLRAGFEARVIVSPTQDMVIGAYVAGAWEELHDGTTIKDMKYFFSFDDALRAYDNGAIDLNQRICVRCEPDYAPPGGETIEHRVGERTLRVSVSGSILKKNHEGDVEKAYVITSPGRCLLTKTLNGELTRRTQDPPWPYPGTKAFRRKLLK